MNLNELLKTMVDENASDLHITAGSPPRIRKGGKLIPISNDKLSLEDTRKIIESEISETNKDKLLNGSEVDYSIRFIIVILSIIVFYITKKNLVYPTIFSAIILSIFSNYL